MTLVSVVVPCYNERLNIRPMFDQLVDVAAQSTHEFEFIFVDDGSKDGTWEEISQLIAVDSRVRGHRFVRNFGHSAALEAGLAHSKGDAVVSIDADLQQPPSLIPELIREWESGADVVSTIRESTDGQGFFKLISSKFFYWTLNWISDLELNDGEADFRLLSRRVVNELNALPESPKFYRGLVPWLGFPTKSIRYSATHRVHGSSSYSLAKMFELARVGLTSFSMKPLKLIAGVGLGLITASILLLLVMLSVKLFVDGEFFSNIAFFVVFQVLVAGVILFSQGLIALYLVDIYDSSKKRPAYLIRDSR